MVRLYNFIKSGAADLDARGAVARFGLVSSFDPSAFAAKVMLQPENVLTGWLPIISPWVGAGWGLAAPLIVGAQVLVIAQEGDAEHGVILGAVWSTVDKPLSAPTGELWLQHQSGSYLKLLNNGTITLQASQVNITGNLLVNGNISDVGGARGTLAAFRQAYDQHEHNIPQGGTTGLPSVTV